MEKNENYNVEVFEGGVCMGCENVNEIFNDYIMNYPMNKTTRFSLIPVGKTEENLKSNWQNTKDELRFLKYPDAKKIMDGFIKEYITERLLIISEEKKIDLKPLVDVYKEYISANSEKKAKLKPKYEKEQEKVRKQIVKYFPKNEWEKMMGKNLYGKDGYLAQKKISGVDADTMAVFDKFSTYFVNYGQSRANFFSSEEKSTAVAYRIVNENFQKYMQNVDMLNTVKKDYQELFDRIIAEHPEVMDICDETNYILFIEQAQINTYNNLIGDINKQMNLYFQQIKDKKKKIKLVSLFGQIMGDNDKEFLIDAFESDEDVYKGIDSLFTIFEENDVFEAFNRIYTSYKDYELNKVFIRDNNELSVVLGEKWNTITNIMIKLITDNYNNLGKKVNPEKIEYEATHNKYSISDIQTAVDYFENSLNNSEGNSEQRKHIDICDIFKIISDRADKVNVCRSNYEVFVEENELPLKEADVSPIKEYLDSMLSVFQLTKLFEEDENGDSNLYAELSMLKEYSDNLINLYNKVRNYVTMKPGDTKKMKLMFNFPEFCNGFASTKIDSYASFILRKDGHYYLGVFNKDKKTKFVVKSSKDDNYEFLIYNQLADSKKSIPKGSIQLKEVKKHFESSNDDYYVKTDSFIHPFKITKSDYDLYFTEYGEKQVKKFQKDYLLVNNDYAGYKAALKQWIEFCINFLESYKSTSSFDLSDVRNVDKYEYLSDFYTELDTVLYSVKFEKMSKRIIDDMVEEGSLYLFEIYNKDFSEKSTGKKNLHTLYWQQIFSEENFNNRVFKLNGGAELFYRPESIKKPVKHETGSILLNKHYTVIKDGKEIKETLPDDVYVNWYQYLNGNKNIVLSDYDLSFENAIEYREAPHEIVKDKRYTKGHFEFHVPFTINYSALGNGRINADVLRTLKNNPNVNVIGIDRGERNLLAYTIVNQQGEIIAQNSFNCVGGVNYKDKLHGKERDRDAARKNWKNIGNIKDLKSGYLSQVVHELTKLMVKYNAIIVMEDLNVGFKRGRMKVERQVYQKFEKALIDKLNYLVVSKDEKDILNPGGILKGYQLTEKFETFKSMGRQNGFMFYVPAGYTSKIDPTTGFVDVFNLTDTTTAAGKKNFFSKFEDISYDEKLGLFKFSFDYNDFSTYGEMARTKWDVYTNGEKYRWNKKEEKQEKVSPNNKMIECLQNAGINDYNNLFEQIMEQSDSPSNASFWNSLFYAFTVSMQLRSSKVDTEGSIGLNDDKIISPVLNKNGEFFETTGDYSSLLPADADTNGSFNIAMKGVLMLKKLKNLKEDKKGKYDLSELNVKNSEWFKFMQEDRNV